MTRDPETLAKAIATIDELLVLEVRRTGTLRELRRVLMICQLAPDMLEPGVKATIRVEGGLTYSHFGDCPSVRSLFVVRSSKGVEVRKPLFEVPLELWPEHMAEALRRREPKKYKQLAGEL